jgi:hypothetical protein
MSTPVQYLFIISVIFLLINNIKTNYTPRTDDMPFGFLQDAQKTLRRVYPPASRKIDNVTSKVFDINRTIAGWADANPYEDPQRSYSWEVSFRNPFNDDNSTMKFYVNSTGIPTDTNEVIKRYYAGVPYNIPVRRTLLRFLV